MDRRVVLTEMRKIREALKPKLAVLLKEQDVAKTLWVDRQFQSHIHFNDVYVR